MMNTFLMKRKNEPSDPGSPVKPVFEGRYNENGRLMVVKTGEANIYEEIQSHAASCDLNVIVRRYLAGDTSALSRVQGFYADISDAPKTFAEMMNVIKIGEDYFGALPIEVREAFGQDSGRFLAGLSDGSTQKIMYQFEVSRRKKLEEVKSNAESLQDVDGV